MTSSFVSVTWPKNEPQQTSLHPSPPKKLLAGFLCIFYTGTFLVGMGAGLNQKRASLITLGSILLSMSIGATLFIIYKLFPAAKGKLKKSSNFKLEPLLPVQQTLQNTLIEKNKISPIFYPDDEPQALQG